VKRGLANLPDCRQPGGRPELPRTLFVPASCAFAAPLRTGWPGFAEQVFSKQLAVTK
jgi:hypothetical protein